MCVLSSTCSGVSVKLYNFEIDNGKDVSRLMVSSLSEDLPISDNGSRQGTGNTNLWATKVLWLATVPK